MTNAGLIHQASLLACATIHAMRFIRRRPYFIVLYGLIGWGVYVNTDDWRMAFIVLFWLTIGIWYGRSTIDDLDIMTPPSSATAPRSTGPAPDQDRP